MKIKKIIKILLPTFVVTILVVVIGVVSFFNESDRLKMQLRDDLNNRILEGLNEIGAVKSNDVKWNGMLEVLPTKEFNPFDPIVKMLYEVPTISSWGGAILVSEDYVAAQCLDLSKSKYFAARSNFCPEIIVLKRENDEKYILYGEAIVAILISENGSQLLVETDKESIYGQYKIDWESIKRIFINNITTTKYSDCQFRNERRISSELGIGGRPLYKYPKHDMLNSIQTKDVSTSNSLNYRVNDYYELKPDKYFDYIGSSPVTTYVNSFGNAFYTVFYRTYECHFAIEENSGILMSEYFKKYGIASGIVMLLTISFSYFYYTRISDKKHLTTELK